MNQLAATLKPEYAEALRRVEIDGIPVKQYASESGITDNNAAVRVFRARHALRSRVELSCGTVRGAWLFGVQLPATAEYCLKPGALAAHRGPQRRSPCDTL